MQRTSSKARNVVGRWQLQVQSKGAAYFTLHALHTKQWKTTASKMMDVNINAGHDQLLDTLVSIL
jgi:hypothetical protein